MSLNEHTVGSATQLLSRKLGAKVLTTGESFGRRMSGFNRVNSNYGPSWGRKMRNSSKQSSVL